MKRLGPLCIIFVIIYTLFLTGCTAGREAIVVTATPSAATETALLDDPLANRAIAASDLPKIPAGWVVDCVDAHSPVNAVVVRQFCRPGVWNTPAITPSPTVDFNPTVTPIPTNTPRTPTKTPTPTATRTPTVAATDDDMPTQEATIDQITNEPDPTICYVRTGQKATYPLRSNHASTAPKLSDVGGSLTLTALGFYVILDGRDEWVKTTYKGVTGWVWIDEDFYVGWDDTEIACITHPDTEYEDNPPPTPAPTANVPTPTPIPPVVTTCEILNFATFDKNVRVAHDVNSDVAFKMPPGAKATVKQFYYIGDDKWASVLYTVPATGEKLGGWAAVVLSKMVIYQLIGDDDANGPCKKIQVVRGIDVGWHLTQGAQWNPLSSTVMDYGAVKSTDLTKDVAQTFKQVNPNALWVHRSIFGSGGAVNCPTFEWTSPGVWVDRYRYTWPTGAQYIETINECQTGPGGATFNNFVIESTRYANTLGFCVLVFSFASGTPDYPEWSALLPILKWIDANPCKTVNGKPMYNGVALHGAFCSGPGMMSNEWTRETHICDRHMYIRDELLKATGYDLYNFKGPIVYTEFGIDAGYGGTSADPTWPTDKWLEVVDYTLDLFEREGLIDAIILWNLGDGGAGQWISREAWIDPLAGLLRGRAQ